MKIQRVKFNVFDKFRMKQWREANDIPAYINASYIGTTGVKELPFPTYNSKLGYYPDITEATIRYEEEILQELKDIRPQNRFWKKYSWVQRFLHCPKA